MRYLKVKRALIWAYFTSSTSKNQRDNHRHKASANIVIRANEILSNGGKIFTGTHALSSVERAIRKDFGTLQPLELIANTLRLMGEGTKVCVEIVLMAADAGLIPIDRDVIAIAGTGRGSDTALRILPANTVRFFDLKIREILAKPSNF